MARVACADMFDPAQVSVFHGKLIFWKTDAEKDFFRFDLPNLARDMDLHPDGLQVAMAHYDRHVRITRLAAKIA